MKRDLVSVLEACYCLDASDEAWLLGVALAVRPILDCGLGLLAWYYDASRAGYLRTSGFVSVDRGAGRLGASGPRRGARGREAHRSGIPPAFVSYVFGGCRWGSLAHRDVHRMLDVGGRGVHLFNAADPSGRGCVVGAAVAGRRSPAVRSALLWGRLAAHMAAGLRIRHRLLRLAGGGGGLPEPEAVVGTDGHIHHASGAARAPHALAALRRAALAADRARGALRRANPQRAVMLWQGLVDGRWTLLDQFERGGRRVLIAHRNDPQVASPRAVSLRERQVLAYAGLGHSTKLIAYELGLSVGATSAYLATAMRKLGLRSRIQLVELARWGQSSGEGGGTTDGGPPGDGGGGRRGDGGGCAGGDLS